MVARTLGQPSSLARPLATQRLVERGDHLGLVEFAAGDELKQAKGCAVERVVAGAGRQWPDERSNLGIAGRRGRRRRQRRVGGSSPRRVR